MEIEIELEKFLGIGVDVVADDPRTAYALTDAKGRGRATVTDDDRHWIGEMVRIMGTHRQSAAGGGVRSR